MADEQPNPDLDDSPDPRRSWLVYLAALLALVVAAAGLFVAERGPTATASAGPKLVATVHSDSAASAGAHGATLDAQITRVRTVTADLRAASSVLTQSLPRLAPAVSTSTAAVADSASQAATLSQRLAQLAAARRVDVVQTNSTASALRAALSNTQARAIAIPAQVPNLLEFCPFTIQIGPIIIDIPAVGIHIVIGPIFIHFEAPCFLSGRIPTHLPR